MAIAEDLKVTNRVVDKVDKVDRKVDNVDDKVDKVDDKVDKVDVKVDNVDSKVTVLIDGAQIVLFDYFVFLRMYIPDVKEARERCAITVDEENRSYSDLIAVDSLG